MTAELERVRADFRHLMRVVGEDEWDGATAGTKWTNEQLLFHMVFGYMVVLRLLRLVRIFGRLPDAFSRGYARMLNAAAQPFHLVNYYGTCLATTFYNRNRMGAKMDRTIASLQRRIAGLDDGALRRGMFFPTRWDPYFREYMSLADVCRYPGQHYGHHRRQLRLSNCSRA